MRTIWKYRLQTEYDKQSIQMPSGGIIRSVGMQDESICLWVEIEDTSPLETRRFTIFGTGWDMPKDDPPYFSAIYIGTVHQISGDATYVWHIYETDGYQW